MESQFPEYEELKDLAETPAAAPMPPAEAPTALPERSNFATRVTRRVVIGLLLFVVLLPPTAGFYSFFSGVPLHLLASTKEPESARPASADAGVSLAPNQARTVDVTVGVCNVLGIHKPSGDAIVVVNPATKMRPLVLPGSTGLDPGRTARIRARFAPARVIELAQIHDFAPKSGQTEFRELRPGDSVLKGALLGVFFSVDVSNKKNAMLDALVQLDLDQKILDRAEAHRNAVPEVFYLTQLRAVEGDRNAINNALSTLRLWDIPQEEIDALHARAKEITANKEEWLKTPEGKWVKGVKRPTGTADTNHQPTEDWGGRVTLTAPFDGVVVERNVTVDEMVVDNTVNLFQIADVSRLLVTANCPEDALPTLEALQNDQRHWTVRTVGASGEAGLPGEIAEISYLIDQNQHTAVVKGYVENPGKHLRAGQYVTATIEVPPPDGIVEIPVDAIVDDGRESLVFVQPDPTVHRFTMRRVHVRQRFEHTVFVDSTPPAESERLTPEDVEEGLLPKEALRPGERILTSGVLELKAALADLEEAQSHRQQQLVHAESTRK